MDGQFITAAVGIISGVVGAAGGGYAMVRSFKNSIKTETEEKELLKSSVSNCITKIDAIEENEMEYKRSLKEMNLSLSASQTFITDSLGKLHSKFNDFALNHEGRLSWCESKLNGRDKK